VPATLKSITSKTNTVAVEIDGDPKAITVKYTTRKVTPRTMKALHEGLSNGTDPSGMDSIIDQLLAMVTEWDLRPDEGMDIIPLTKEALQDVPLEVLTLVVGAVTDDQVPKEQTDGSSNTP
jgi:hypothetical protein